MIWAIMELISKKNVYYNPVSRKRPHLKKWAEDLNKHFSKEDIPMIESQQALIIGGSGLVAVVSDSSLTPWTVAHQSPLSIGFPRQEY